MNLLMLHFMSTADRHAEYLRASRKQAAIFAFAAYRCNNNIPEGNYHDGSFEKGRFA